MDSTDSSSKLIATRVVEEVFVQSIEALVVLSDIDIEIAAISKKERRQLLDRLDRLQQSVPLDAPVGWVLDSVAAEIDRGTIGLYVCETFGDAVTVLTQIYNRLKAVGKHDGYETGKLTRSVGFVRLWLD